MPHGSSRKYSILQKQIEDAHDASDWGGHAAYSHTATAWPSEGVLRSDSHHARFQLLRRWQAPNKLQHLATMGQPHQRLETSEWCMVKQFSASLALNRSVVMSSSSVPHVAPPNTKTQYGQPHRKLRAHPATHLPGEAAAAALTQAIL